VRVEARTEAAGAAEREASGRELTGLIKENVGVTCSVEVLEPNLIERSAGKAQRIVDLRRSP